jgi:hypothetical protein
MDTKIAEGSVAIATMLGWKYNDVFGLWNEDMRHGYSFIKTDEMRFHFDYNWMMDAIDFIENIKTDTIESIETTINKRTVVFRVDKKYAFEKGDGGRSSQPIRFNGDAYVYGKDRKEAIFKALVAFAGEYNKGNIK